MISARTLKVFLWSWFSFAWFFVAVIAVMNRNRPRTFAEWLVRGVIGGFFVGAVSAYVEHRKRAKELLEPPANEEL